MVKPVADAMATMAQGGRLAVSLSTIPHHIPGQRRHLTGATDSGSFALALLRGAGDDTGRPGSGKIPVSAGILRQLRSTGIDSQSAADAGSNEAPAPRVEGPILMGWNWACVCPRPGYRQLSAFGERWRLMANVWGGRGRLLWFAWVWFSPAEQEEPWHGSETRKGQHNEHDHLGQGDLRFSSSSSPFF